MRLLLKLLFNPSFALYANDLDTLAPNYIISKLCNRPLIYDTHEVFTEVPELQGRPFKRNTWLAIERCIFPQLTKVITVNQSIADWYKAKYGNTCQIVRNIPDLAVSEHLSINDKTALKRQLGLPLTGDIVILQGAGININRGAEELLEAMQFLDEVTLVIIGGGDVYPTLKDMANQLKIQDKVLFFNKQPFLKMMQYTRCATLGLSLDKDTNLNYRFSLPNKLFDYLHAGIPVLASRLIEIERIILQYNVGGFIDNHDPEKIASKLRSVLADKVTLDTWQRNIPKALEELNWQHEKMGIVQLTKDWVG